MYKDCYDLQLSVFIDCIVDKNYSGLAVDGKYADGELRARWELIYEQYAELSGNGGYSDYVRKLKDYTATMYREQILVGAITVLRFEFNQDAINALREAGFKANLDIKNPLKYAEGLTALAAQIPSMNIRKKRLETELEQLRKGMEGKEPTRADFVKAIAGISKFMGFRVDTKQTTVAEFVTYQNDMIELSKKMTLKNGRGKN